MSPQKKPRNKPVTDGAVTKDKLVLKLRSAEKKLAKADKAGTKKKLTNSEAIVSRKKKNKTHDDEGGDGTSKSIK